MYQRVVEFASVRVYMLLRLILCVSRSRCLKLAAFVVEILED